MDAEQIRGALEHDVIDTALIHLSHTDYLRDFQMYFYFPTHDARTHPPVVVKYRFLHCVTAEITSSLSPEIWRGSLSDNLIGDLKDVDYPVDGWVWATRFGDMNPGATFFESSDEADRWSEATGTKFYEALCEAPPLRIRLVFSDLMVEEAVSGDSPFTVE